MWALRFMRDFCTFLGAAFLALTLIGPMFAPISINGAFLPLFAGVATILKDFIWGEGNGDA